MTCEWSKLGASAVLSQASRDYQTSAPATSCSSQKRRSSTWSGSSRTRASPGGWSTSTRGASPRRRTSTRSSGTACGTPRTPGSPASSASSHHPPSYLSRCSALINLCSPICALCSCQTAASPEKSMSTCGSSISISWIHCIQASPALSRHCRAGLPRLTAFPPVHFAWSFPLNSFSTP